MATIASGPACAAPMPVIPSSVSTSMSTICRTAMWRPRAEAGWNGASSGTSTRRVTTSVISMALLLPRRSLVSELVREVDDVDHVLEAAGEVVPKVGQKDEQSPPAALVCPACDVRGGPQIGQAPQLARLGQGLERGDVEHHPAQAPGAERRGEGGFVDERAARDVDQERARLHRLELGGAQEAAAGRVEARRQKDEVARSEKLGQLTGPQHALRRSLLVLLRM